MRHNLDTLKFLLNSFKDLVNRFGRSVNTVDYFKQNLEGLVRVSQISSYDSELVLDILGIKSTNTARWSELEEKLAQYEYAVNQITTGYLTGKEAKERLNKMTYTGKELTPTVKRLVIETFGEDRFKDKPIRSSYSSGSSSSSGGYSYSGCGSSSSYSSYSGGYRTPLGC